MLLLDQENYISFSVSISGTSSEPSVRMVLCLDPMVIYPAHREDSGKWAVNVKLPKDTEPGEYEFTIEATVAGRLFVPIKSTVEVGKIEIEVSELKFGKTPGVVPNTADISVSDQFKQTESSEVEQPQIDNITPLPAGSGVGNLLLNLLKEKNSTKIYSLNNSMSEVQTASASHLQPEKNLELSRREQLRILAGITSRK